MISPACRMGSEQLVHRVHTGVKMNLILSVTYNLKIEQDTTWLLFLSGQKVVHSNEL